MPQELAEFRVEDWCDPTADPPEWYMAAITGRVYWSLAAGSTVEGYWYMHARMAWQRARTAWVREHHDGDAFAMLHPETAANLAAARHASPMTR
jgi:hypothetical protein